ncbi:MAG TPA: alanyl-tRNA editing protein [Bryobacteraceae bacterium]|nr:alanyl-tRNA editing protein [Bryobacteraceae bacterium]
MTERLYYHDSYLHRFDALALECGGEGAATVYLDRTAFYPTSGGQPFDLGSIAGVAVRDVIDEGDRIAHLLAAPVAPGPVECSIDWTRRFDHMQQHTGQHLLSAVFEELFHLRTVSFHLGAESSTIDLEGGAADARVLEAVEARANAIVWENRPVVVTYEDAASVQGLRKASDREGTLRIVSIDRLDRSACGGTHVRGTGEIGAILLRKLEKVRQSVRVEFLCGGRAVRRARADFEALSRVAQLFSSALDDVPAVVAAQMEAARGADKLRRKLEIELAAYQGGELYRNTAPGPDGLRRAVHRATSGSLDELRALAQSFTAQPRAVFVATLTGPPSILLATSADSGVDAGQRLKAALAEAGGRGGGTARMAQGSVPGAAILEKLGAALLEPRP